MSAFAPTIKLESSYICPKCKESIGTTDPNVALWVMKVAEFLNKHRKHGFEL